MMDASSSSGIARLVFLIGGIWLGFVVQAQDVRTYRIGLLTLGWQAQQAPKPLRDRLSELGYVEGRNLILENRSAVGEQRLLERYAKDLVSRKVDLILALATPSAQAAMQATSTIPIVFFAVVDPVGAGLVSNLARPDKNLTGMSLLSAELSAKRLELLQELVPKLSTVGVLANALNESNAIQLDEIRTAADARGVKLRLLEIRSAKDIDKVLDAGSSSGFQALIALDDPVIIRERKRLAELAALRQLPSMSGFPIAAEAGFLVAYGPDLDEQLRAAADFAHRILSGARPADLPVEQPRRFTLVLNLQTARQIGVAIPRAMLPRADKIIE